MQLTVDTHLTEDVLHLINVTQAWHYKIIPFKKEQNTLIFWIDQNQNLQEIAIELDFVFDESIQLLPVESGLIALHLSKFYRRESVQSRGEKQVEETISTENDVDFLQKMVYEAKDLGSSDIHIEIYEELCRVRVRIDGLLVERYRLTKEDYPSIINKIKIQANLDIAEKRLPQDGRIFFSLHDVKFDIRVSVLPTLHGEKIVMRILSNDATNIDLSTLGFEQKDLDTYIESIKKPHGIILISGPTGSGKTTTLYATLKMLNKTTRNVLTIEDPIEYTLDGINQVQLKESIGLTFAAALRTFLRQDPDVIMLGEIRDAETATMAIRAALTGHLVLSTIHTNSAWGTVSRLIDMGVPSFLLANTLNLSVAQRLVRKLCPQCKEATEVNEAIYPKSFKPPYPVTIQYKAVGCDHCHYTGYKGRKAVYEVLPIDIDMALAIRSGSLEVSDLLEEKKVKTIASNAFELFAKGETSIEEVYTLLYQTI